MTGDRRIRRPLICLLFLLFGLVLPGPARAAIDLEALHFSSVEASGEPSVLAGAHPARVTTSFVVASRDDGQGQLPIESARNIVVDLPPGMVGNPAALPRCSQSDIEAEGGGCPPETQIGYVELITPANPGSPALAFPMYNLKPTAGFAAMFGLTINQARTRVVAELDPNRDYGVSIVVRNLPQAVPWTQLNVVIWGTPGGRPLLTNPSACMPELSIEARVDSWQDPDVYDSATASNEDSAGRPVGISGCGDLGFDPTLTVAPSAAAPRTPTGFTLALHAPLTEDSHGRAEATLEQATVTLPRGFAISPSAGAGLEACSAAQIELGTGDPPSCPDASKLGSLKFETPLLGEPLTGSIYLARPWDNPSGSRFAVYGVAEGSGVLVKVAGHVDADPATGQLRVSFDHIPQLPFDDLEVQFWGGPRALLSTPPRCGAYAGDSELKAWGAASRVERPLSLELSSDCSSPRFSPGLSAGVRTPVAAGFSSFALRLWREDSDEELASLSSIDLPPGLAIALKGTTSCPDSVLATTEAGDSAAPDCPASSRLGSVLVGAGPGPDPLYMAPGDVYLAGPYRGAPFSLAISVPARVGPFDLGQVNLRAPLRIDPTDLHAEIDVGPLPTVLAGVPLQVRDLRLEIDRPHFVRTPSSCDTSAVTAHVVSAGGTTAVPTNRFRVSGCGRLGFEPRLSLSFSGAPTRRGGHPRLRALVRTRPGDANIGRLSLTMPETELLDSTHLRQVCSRARYAANRCPEGSVYGYAKVWSPLLEKPLRGPLYLRGSNRRLPDLVASLDGQLHIDLAGRIESSGGRIRSVFAPPDVPISRFVLTTLGGRKGLLVNNTELCRAKPRAQVAFGAHNGRRSSFSVPVAAGCAPDR